MQEKSLKLLFVVNIPRFFLSHRLPLALAARDAGYEVHVAASDADRPSKERIRDAGLPFHPLPLSQHGLNPIRELRTLLALRRLYIDLKPDLIHHVSIKPIIYGGLAARLSGRKRVVHAMSGLGYVFVSRDLRARLLNVLCRPAFKIALSGPSTRMIFQNPDDRRVFLERALIGEGSTAVIMGSGVDEERFRPRDENLCGKPVVLFAGRLLWRKGLDDFVEVARRLRGQAHFRVAGYEEETSPLNVPASQLQAWADEGLIEWLGKRTDMPEVYAECNIVCLPSTYGEGVPKVLIEAASCGRACITTDSPGCREIVQHGANGLLAPPNAPEALRAAVQCLIDDPAKRTDMGARGRQMVLDGFTQRKVSEDTLALYRSLL